MASDKRVNVSKAKSMLGCSDDTVRRRIEAGVLHGRDIRKPGAKRAVWSVSLESIQRYISESRATGEDSAA
jgi:hypothetical protein